jgi:hypothetical protein
MTEKKSSSKKRTVVLDRKQTRTSLARAAKNHFPQVKKAAERALRDAGLGGLRVHTMTFSVDEDSVVDQCSPPCGPDEQCKLSSSGQWVCVPNR